PDAPVKLFVTASAEIRAHRRWLELSVNDPSLKEADILEAVIARDKKDMERAIAPLRPAEDAHLLDTSDLGIENAFEAALKLITSIGG
ncbi:MAG: (d)CMP kinase, partial [Candidatus Micropelagos thuwalensis]